MMYRKLFFLVCLIALLGLVNSASAATWDGGGTGDSWCTAGNWDPDGVPSANEGVEIDPPPYRGPVIDCDVECGAIQGPVWDSDSSQVMDIESGTVVINGRWRFANGGSGIPTINITGGDITIDGSWRWADGGDTYGIVNVSGGSICCNGIQIGDSGGGEINVSGIGCIDIDGDLNLGGDRGDVPITVNMTSGSITVTGEFMCPANQDRAGVVTVNLDAGNIECGSFSHADVAYSMDIEEGMFVIDGNVVADIEADVNDGYITAFNGSAAVEYTYDPCSDKTTVCSSIRKKAWNPNPANYAKDVCPGVSLSWIPGEYADTHDIYFGTSLDDVDENATAYIADHDSNSFRPSLEFGKTYYWRVDEVNDSNLWTGFIWQFTTDDGKARNHSPTDGADPVPVDANLSWTPGVAAALHDVYFGTDFNDVNEATDPYTPPGRGRQNLDANSYDPPGFLELGQTYYWRIDEVNDANLWPGDVRHFTVEDGKANNPNPADRNVWVPLDVNLSWTPGALAIWHDVYFGTDFNDVNDATDPDVLPGRGQQTLTSYEPNSLEKATTYYWRIDEVGASTYIRGDVWQFTTIGALSLKVDLALPQWENTSEVVPGSAKPSWYHWAASRWADMYMHDPVWEDGSDSDSKPTDSGIRGSGVHALICCGNPGQGGVHVKGMCRGGLAGNLPPYDSPEGDPIANSWLYAVDWAGEYNGDVMLVLTDLPPAEYELYSYHNHWEPCTQATRNCMDCVCENPHMPPMPSITANPLPHEPLPGYFHGWGPPLGTGTGVVAIENAYDVQPTHFYSDDELVPSLIRFRTDGSEVLIIYKAGSNDYPDCAREGREGSRGILNAFHLLFVKELDVAYNASPASHAEGVDPKAVLSWSPGLYAVKHDVYFGTDFDDVNNATDPNTLPGRGRQDANSYDPPGDLELDTTYYWRIDEVNDPCIWKGDIWSFTVAEYLIVDDMESYTPEEPNRLYDTWHDWTLSKPVGGQYPTSAQLTLETADANVHSGKQSMKFEYNNSDSGAWMFYRNISEIDANTIGPLMYLEIGQDWTILGVKVLTLHFIGHSDNDANEQMYVALADSAGHTAVVPYGYYDNEDMNDIKNEEWQEWNILLEDFNDINNVNVADVNNVYIGFGNRDNPVVGGSGVVFFDDIRLYPPKCAPGRGPVADFSGNCIVEFEDFAILGNQWLQPPGSPSADISEPPDGVVNMLDLDVLTESWLEEKLWPLE